nr:hypothetical protein [Kiritimatiella glycovorans]
MVGRPGRKVPLTEEVFEVELEFRETSARHARQLQLALFRRRGVHAPFGDVLPTASRGLDHLFAHPALRAQKTVAEKRGDIINDPGEPEGLEPAVAAVRRD